MKYYLVTAKCGHVGKGKYIEVDFPIYARTKNEAAQKCLKKKKVKKQLKNAISWVREITLEEYEQKLISFKNNKYIKAHTKREIIEYWEIARAMSNDNQRKRSFQNREERIAYILKKNKIREAYQYA